MDFKYRVFGFSRVLFFKSGLEVVDGMNLTGFVDRIVGGFGYVYRC